MSKPVKLIAFSGSLRSQSHNQQLVELAAAGAIAAGAQVEFIRLKSFDLPMYDGDLEQASGLPEGAARLKALFADSDGFLISSPEYNSSLSGALKNAIDWVTRTETGEPDATLKAFRGKVAGIMSASPGPWGGMRGLVHLRQILSGLQVLVVAEQLAVPLSHQAFDENGALKNPLHNTIIDTIGKRAAQLGRALKQT